MKRCLGIIKYEYYMAVRRWGIWVAYAVMCLPYVVPLFVTDTAAADPIPTTIPELWAMVGLGVFRLNVFLPILAGIAAADRFARDSKLRTDELFSSTPLDRRVYILGKYMGVLLSTLTPALVLVVFYIISMLATGAPAVIIPMMLSGFLAITVPSFAFVTAFSLVCPMIMPVRVYQVLFTGYWFWGNFLNPSFFPTISGTLMNASGEYVLEAFFATTVSSQAPVHTPLDAAFNLLFLSGSIFIVLFALERFLAYKARHA